VPAVSRPVAAQEQLGPQGGTVPAVAGNGDPALVVTLGSMDKLTNDVNYVTGIVGQPQAGAIFSMMAGQFTRGIDTTQPIGIVVTLVDGAPEPIALIPTADVKQVLKSIEPQTGPADEQADGTLIIALGPYVAHIRQMGNWAAIARSSELLNQAPANPNALFAGMGNDYDIAVRLKVQQVPPEARDMLIAQLRQGFEQAMAQQAEADQDSTREMAEGTIKQLEMVINDTDELKFGWNVDQPGKQMNIDVSFTAMPGTKLAQMYGGQHSIASNFSSVIRPDAAAYYHAASSISPVAIEQAKKSVDGSLSALRKSMENSDKLDDEQRAEISAMVDRLVKLMVDSISEGKMDMGGLLLADESDFKFAFGAFVSDGQEAAQIVKDLAAKVKDEPNAPRFMFDQSTYNGVTMHRIEADVPESEDEVRSVFGDKLNVHLGTGAKSLYLAVGNDSDSLMKELIDSSGSDSSSNRPMAQLRLTLLPILQFAQSVEPNDSVAAMIDALSRAPDAGLITAVGDSLPNGQSTRLTIGEGLLQAIGAAGRQAQQAAQADQF
tara:strand:+ start:216558 stop:218204 length:1647 start_codon:yes stop_codon:yes gene_type:complete